MSVSIKEVAAAAGVSVGTVSNVLNRPEKVAESTVRRVTAAIDELGFVRNDAARQLRAGRSRSIGLVVLDAANPFFADVARGAEDRAGEAGMVVLLGNTDEAPAREDAYLDLFREQRVNGVLITPAGDDIPKLERLRTAGIPVVLVDHDAPGSGLASVAVDDVEGGYLAVAHLLAQGRRRVVFVGGSPSIRQVAGSRVPAERCARCRRRRSRRWRSQPSPCFRVVRPVSASWRWPRATGRTPSLPPTTCSRSDSFRPSP